ncbi:MAG: hypothetical protein HYT61_00580 [Candidatus Yanofskybacteria bacterium]|nr:hypothetical protein [Candidatus Yanofskybacteria bacterium]
MSKQQSEKLLKKETEERSGRKCHCGGDVIRIKFWRVYIPPSLRDFVMGVIEETQYVEDFTPFHCKKCGIQYFKLPEKR